MTQYLYPNSSYNITITGGPSGSTVVGNAMAKLNISIENKWVNVLEAFGFGGGSGGSTIGNIASAALLVSGNNLVPVIATSHVWRGSSGIELSLDMRFDAVQDASQDVLANVQTLVGMWSPTRGSGTGAIAGAITSAANSIASALGGTTGGGLFLTPPGPTPTDLFSAMSGGGSVVGNTMTVILGRVMTIQNLIPTTISWEFENRFRPNGDPIAAMVKLGLISYTTPSQSDLLGYFQNQVSQISGSSSSMSSPTGGAVSGASAPSQDSYSAGGGF